MIILAVPQSLVNPEETAGSPLHREKRENGNNNKSPFHGIHKEFGNFVETQAILFAQVEFP